MVHHHSVSNRTPFAPKNGRQASAYLPILAAARHSVKHSIQLVQRQCVRAITTPNLKTVDVSLHEARANGHRTIGSPGQPWCTKPPAPVQCRYSAWRARFRLNGHRPRSHQLAARPRSVPSERRRTAGCLPVSTAAQRQPPYGKLRSPNGIPPSNPYFLLWPSFRTRSQTGTYPRALRPRPGIFSSRKVSFYLLPAV